MDAAAQLALMVKAKAVFGAPDTFVSFPVSPLPYTKRQLDFYAQSSAGEVAESLQHLHAFSTLVNLVPGGEAWVPTESRYLWDAYRAMLEGHFADSQRTADEEADYQRALGFLRRTHLDGTLKTVMPSGRTSSTRMPGSSPSSGSPRPGRRPRPPLTMRTAGAGASRRSRRSAPSSRRWNGPGFSRDTGTTWRTCRRARSV